MPNKINDYQYCTKYQIYIYQYKLKYQKNLQENRELISVEYHTLKEKQFCSGVQFVAKENGIDEDDGWQSLMFMMRKQTSLRQLKCLLKKHSTLYHYFHAFLNLSDFLSSVGLYYRCQEIFRGASSKNYFASESSIWFPWELFLHK